MSEVLYMPSRWGQVYHSITDQDTPCTVCGDDYEQHLESREHLFIGERIHEILGAGAAGPGKTEVLINDALPIIQMEHERCLDKRRDDYHPMGSSTAWILFLRRTRPRLQHTIKRAMKVFKGIDNGFKWNSTDTTATFSSGLVFQFGHCKDPNDWQQYMGAEFVAIYFDELVEFEEEQYLQISGRLRTTDASLMPYLRIRAMSNPTPASQGKDGIVAKDPNWVRRRFVDPEPGGKKILRKTMKRADGEEFIRRRLYLPATLYDNPDPNFVSTYEQELLDKPDHIQQALLYGNWYVTVGSFYAEYWRDHLHVCDPFMIPDDWPRFRSMDWGFKTHGVILWWAMDPEGNMYCEKEFSFRLREDVQVAEDVIDYEQSMRLTNREGQSKLSGPADTQLWEERGGDVAETKAARMEAKGVFWDKADKKSRRRNAELLQGRLADHHEETTIPGIIFFRTCKMCIKQIPGIQTSQNDLECPADGGDDHWHDAILYACAYASHGREGIVYQGAEEEEDDWDDGDGGTGHRGSHGYGGY